MQINDIELHAQGASTFTDDIPLPQGTLHAFPIVSTRSLSENKPLKRAPPI